MNRLVARARSFWRGLRHPGKLEAEMDEEMRFHIGMEAGRLARERGLDPDEALRQAAIAFGGVDRRKEEGRDVRGLTWLTGAALDLKLGLRLLYKYPTLTLVGALGMAFAVSVGALGLRVLMLHTNPSIPLDEGDRVVGIQFWSAERNRLDHQSSLAYARWREELESVKQVGAFRDVQRNLEIEDRSLGPVEVAEISAAGFPLTRVPPSLGRTLIEADEVPGSPPVVVIGHQFWQAQLDGDPGVVGRAIRLGGVVHTVVGVMPVGFAFPVDHALWVPLRLDPHTYGPWEGPEIRVFGRLAAGVSLQAAQAELDALNRRLAMDYPELRARSRVLPYPDAVLALDEDPDMRVIYLLGYLLVAALFTLICGNIALLLFARAATRQDELAVRTALGASRGRIIAQLFAEAVVLSGVAAVLGTGVLRAGAWYWGRRLEAEAAGLGVGIPFWWDGFLDARYLLIVAGVTLLAAIVVGALPALQVTGRRLEPRLREGSSGAGAYRFSGVWTVLIVVQVAVTLFVPALALKLQEEIVLSRAVKLPFASEEFLTARLEMDEEAPAGAAADSSQAAFVARLQDRYAELERRLLSDPAVVGVSYTNSLPRRYHPFAKIELEEHGRAATAPEPGYRMSSGMVDVRYFDVLGVPIVAGRGFRPSDLSPGERVVIVNRKFVNRITDGQNPVGLRLRFRSSSLPIDESGPWYEIVGVVDDLAMGNATNPLSTTGFYLPAELGTVEPLYLTLRLRGDPLTFAPRLRARVAELDPALRLYRIAPMEQEDDGEFSSGVRILTLVGAIALLLSLTAIYSVMSYVVSRRTRDIGIRVALGADARRVVMAIFRRPLTQVAAGILVGSLAIALVILGATGGHLTMSDAGLLIAYATFMTGVCMIACVVPVRRALRIQPTEAMRER